MSEHKLILSPRSKERALYMLEQNKLEFYVARTGLNWTSKALSALCSKWKLAKSIPELPRKENWLLLN